MACYLSQPRIEDPIWLEPHHISFLQARISEAETAVQRISQLEESKAQNPAQISEFARQKDAKLVEIASLRNVLAPVRRAPLEILSEIFEFSCLPDDDYHLKDRVHSLFVLSAVCAAWRKAAHATPQLWCKLRVLVEDHRHLLSSDFVWVGDWITRCQSLPLEFYLELDMYDLTEPEDALNQRGIALLEYVLAHFSHKIRKLDILGDPVSLLPILQLPRCSPMLSLESVSLSLDEYDEDIRMEDISPFRVEMLLGSPKLQEVKLNSALFLEPLVLPAEQLTSLNLQPNWELAVCWDVLSRCHNLVSLKLSLPSTDSINFDNVPSIISLPALQSFDISYCGETGNFLRRLAAPLLKKMTLWYLTEEVDRVVDSLTSLQQLSATSLSSLVLSYNEGHDSDSKHFVEKTVALFSLFSTICSLEIGSSVNLDPLMQAMTWSKDYHVLPNLSSFLLKCGPGREYLTASVLKAMVISRSWPESIEDDGGSVSVSVDNRLSRLQDVTVRELHLRDSVEDLMHISTLPGVVLNYTPVTTFERLERVYYSSESSKLAQVNGT